LQKSCYLFIYFLFALLVVCGKGEQYILAFHKASGAATAVGIFLYNPNRFNVTYNTTMTAVAGQELLRVNQPLNSGTGASSLVKLTPVLSYGNGAHESRGKESLGAFDNGNIDNYFELHSMQQKFA
jgi:hypothetical protein